MKLRRLSRRWIFLSLRTIGRTLARGGHERLSYWGDRLGRWHYALRPMLTHRLAKDLRVLGSLMNAQSLLRNTNGILRSAFQTNDRAVLELMALYGCVDDPKPLVPPAHIHQIQRIKDVIASGRGAIVLGLHMGNGLSMAVQINDQITPIHVVYRESNKVTPNFFSNGLRGLGLSPINAVGLDGGFRQMMRALRANEAVMILMDQGSKNNGLPVEFLGKPMRMPLGPLELARRSGAPLVPVWLVGRENGWTFEVKDPIYLTASDKIEGQLEYVVSLMEKHILAHPDLWSWHQRRWAKSAFSHTPGA